MRAACREKKRHFLRSLPNKKFYVFHRWASNKGRKMCEITSIMRRTDDRVFRKCETASVHRRRAGSIYGRVKNIYEYFLYAVQSIFMDRFSINPGYTAVRFSFRIFWV